jgi:hypothetical protein
LARKALSSRCSTILNRHKLSQRERRRTWPTGLLDKLKLNARVEDSRAARLIRLRGRPGGYYNLVSASFGFQLGVQERSVIIMFMTNEALAGFEASAGWKVGVDGSVAIVTLGAGGSIDTDKITDPVIGFILDPTGLMLNLTLEGSKISQISP